MRQSFKFAARVSAVSAIACVLTFLSTLSANAQPKEGLDGSYVGGSFSTSSGVTNLGIYGRFDYPKLPISIRGSANLVNANGDTETYFSPAVTYDLPVGGKANAYAGAGVSFGSGDSEFFLNAGAEKEIATNVVVFGDVIAPLSSNSDVGFSVGLGYRF